MTDPAFNTKFIRSLTTLTRKIRTLFDARTSAYGLTQARARVLLHLARTTPMTQADLANEMDVERPTMARLLDGMEAGGLIRRETSREDRRQRHIHLTEAARGDTQAVLELTEKLRADLLAGIPHEDLEVAQRVLDRIMQNICKAE